MIATTPEHIALLQSREFWAVDLYEIRFIDDTILRWDGHALSTSWNGYVWAGGGPIISRGNTRQIRGLESDTLAMDITPRETDTLLGVPLIKAVQNGAFDGARIALYRGHAATPGAPIVGAVLRFQGEIQEVETDVTIHVTVKSDLVKLDATCPRDVWQAGCSRTLYDAGCGVQRSAHLVNASTGAGTTKSVLKVLGLPHADGYYSAGEIRFISGENAGARRSVRVQADADTLRLSYPLLHTPALGDQFQLWPGCAHTVDECEIKFFNKPAFNGQPFVPAPETAL